MREEVEKSFLIHNRRLVKGVSTSKEFFLADEAFEYINGQWKSIDRNQINDKIMGYEMIIPKLIQFNYSSADFAA